MILQMPLIHRFRVSNFIATTQNQPKTITKLGIQEASCLKSRPTKTHTLQGMDTYPTLGSSENHHLQNAIFGGYVSFLEGIFTRLTFQTITLFEFFFSNDKLFQPTVDLEHFWEIVLVSAFFNWEQFGALQKIRRKVGWHQNLQDFVI